MQKIICTNDFMDDYTYVEFEVFTSCNKSCDYCYNLLQHPKRFHNTYDGLISILDRIMQSDNKRVVIGMIGGEPFIHKRFNDVVNHIYDNCDPMHKLQTFTHGDHKPAFHKNRIDNLAKFGDRVKLTTSIHYDYIDYDNFAKNLEYTDSKLKYNVLSTMVGDNIADRIDLLDDLMARTKNTTLHLFVDDREEQDYIQLLKRYNQYQTIMSRYTERMDNYYLVDEKKIPWNVAKMQIIKDNGFVFTGRKCTPTYYEVMQDGSVYQECNRGCLGNVYDSNELFNVRSFPCDIHRCPPNLSKIYVEKTDT